MKCGYRKCFLFIISTHALFFTTGSVSVPEAELKKFIRPAYIKYATAPFAEKYIYVDKTKFALELCKGDDVGETYFFVRPRRFGKSCFLRTLQKVFEGKKDIFRGTQIHRSNYSWNTYPILYLDLGGAVIESENTCGEVALKHAQTQLEVQLDNDLQEFKKNHNLLSANRSLLKHEFVNILEEIRERGNLTVVLIDDYDFAIMQNKKNCPRAMDINKDLVRDLFLELKRKAHLIKFAFVTGISKSTFTTFGSDIDFEDITNDPAFHDIAGLTRLDLDEYYVDYIAKASNDSGKPKSNVTEEVREWYEGYNFSSRTRSSLYNPLSVHNYFKKGEAKEYWPDKEQLEFLFNEMKKRPGEFSCLNPKTGVRSSLQGGTSLDHTDPALLLYDAGYITIHGFENGKYLLKFPNREMEEAFYTDIAYAAKVSKNSTEPEIRIARTALMKVEPDFDGFMAALNRALLKLHIRPPFEEWYSWQTMILINEAGISVQRGTPIEITKGCWKTVDITGSTENTYFLFEVEFNRRGNYDVWRAVSKSIQAALAENNVKEKPLNVLAAGFTFSVDMEGDVVMAYKAKLFAPNGKVLRKYASQRFRRAKGMPDSDELFAKTGK